MVAYNGGKQRHGLAIKQIIEEVEHLLGFQKLPVFDAFVGMCGVARQFAKDASRQVIANDLNPNVIALLREIQKPNWTTHSKFPTHCSKVQYESLKATHEVSAKKGFVGIGCSFNGNYFAGFRKPNPELNRDFLKQFHKGLEKLSRDIQRMKILEASSYDQHDPHDMICYVDSPYAHNNILTPYFSNFDFDHFWDVMRTWSESNLVFISERIAPRDFVCIWKGITRKKNATCDIPMDEKLFVHKNLYAKIRKHFPRC
jgi:site-specific DNA-adenine methylase